LNNAAQTVSSLSGSGGTITFGSSHVLTLNQISNTSYAGALGGAGGLTKSNSGSATISGTSSYSGPTTISGGSLILGSNAALSSASALTLSGGALNLAGFSGTATTLTLGANSTIDFGAAAGLNALSFSDSHAVTWTGTLTILNYSVADADKLRFGTSSSELAPTLTAGQLSSIVFNGYAGGAALDSMGYVSPIPEPASVAAALGAVALLAALRRRRA
jgi:MYXO-CTERM domain-containing protein